MRASGTKRRRGVPTTLSVRLTGQVELESHASGEIVARVEGFQENLGKFSARAIERAQGLRSGLLLASFERDGSDTEREIHLLDPPYEWIYW